MKKTILDAQCIEKIDLSEVDHEIMGFFFKKFFGGENDRVGAVKRRLVIQAKIVLQASFKASTDDVHRTDEAAKASFINLCLLDALQGLDEDKCINSYSNYELGENLSWSISDFFSGDLIAWAETAILYYMSQSVGECGMPVDEHGMCYESIEESIDTMGPFAKMIKKIAAYELAAA